MAPVTAAFPPAPRAGRLCVAPDAAAVCGAVGAAFGVGSALAPHRAPPWPPGATGLPPGLGWFDPAAWQPASPSILVALLAPALIGVFGLLMAYREQAKTAQLRTEDDVLVLGTRRYPLFGAGVVERDPRVLEGARRLRGDGGPGALRGRFRSRRLGRFDAFLTDCEHGGVIRWPDQTVAVSPADPENFLYDARQAAGLCT